MNLTLHTDKPVSRRDQDRFQRYEFSKRVAEVVASPIIDKSLVVGLYGKWGEGKTTVMNFIEQELPPETIRLKFNPWLFSDEQHLLTSFFSSICEAIGASDKTLLEKMGGLLTDYGAGIGWLTQWAGLNGETIKEVGSKLKSGSTEKTKQRIDSLIEESGKNIVVFIDDIDRLDVIEVQYVFKLVKLVADFPRTCYVLSFDDEMVSAALAPRYGGDKRSFGYGFLEKIIQVPLKIPKASRQSLEDYTIGLIENVLKVTGIELKESQIEHFAQIFKSGFLPYIDNPRLAVRYANTLSFSLPLLRGEANTADVMIIEGLKIFYPELHEFMRSNAAVFLTRTDFYHSYDRNEARKNEIRDELNLFISIYSVARQKVVIAMLQQLFPQLSNLYGNNSYREHHYHQWTLEKRICAGGYFDRYFSYSVAQGDISDVQLDLFLVGLQTEPAEVVATQLLEMTSCCAPFDLIQKLKLNSAELGSDQAQKLASAVVRIAHILPTEEMFLSSTKFGGSSLLVRSLFKSIPVQNWVSVAMDLLRMTKSTDFAIDLFYWFCHEDNPGPSGVIVPESEQVIFREHLVTMFVSQVNNVGLFHAAGRANTVRFILWWSQSAQSESLQTFWSRNLCEGDNPQFALEVLLIFIPTVVVTTLGNKGSRSMKANFTSEIYERIKGAIDPLLLNRNLAVSFGDQPFESDPAVLPANEHLEEKTIVSVFQWFLANDDKLQSEQR